MDLLIIRHAPAQERDEFAATGLPDEQRPLTQRGVKRMTAAGRGLMTLALPVERMVASPLVRACQTADILTSALELKGYDIDRYWPPVRRLLRSKNGSVNSPKSNVWRWSAMSLTWVSWWRTYCAASRARSSH